MELGPILRALMHNTTRFWLISLEVALSLAIGWLAERLHQDRGDITPGPAPRDSQEDDAGYRSNAVHPLLRHFSVACSGT